MASQPESLCLGLKRLLAIAASAGSIALLIGAAAIGQEGGSQIPREDVDACMACHSSDMGTARAVNIAALNTSPHKDLKCQDCHSSITAAPHTPEMLKEKASCATCHSDEFEAFSRSAHAKQDQVQGDHPTCASCHGKGDPHGVKAVATLTRINKIALCSTCHRQTNRMTKYGVDTDAVPSYEESFHGKAVLRFGHTKAAICTDCHRYHDVLSSKNPESRTHRNNAANTCGQAGCHPGAKVNFAMSGANHLRLKVKEEPILQVEELLFKTLTIGTILFLLGGIVLDLRVKVFGGGPPPRSGRPIAFLISMSFLLVVVTLLMAYLGTGGVAWSALAATMLLFIALALYAILPKPHYEAARKEPKFQRFTVAQRVQHSLLALSFTTLALTGMPLRFANVEWLEIIYVPFGGLEGARIAHRVAAVVMIFTWVWHTIYLLYRWKKFGFSWKSLSMVPSMKDLKDFVQVSKYYLGFGREEPRYDRFQFREKFDYFAVYWGMPIMVFSGLVLWFPIYFGNRLPEVGLSFAYIAHSDEAILAFLAIVLWHFYNTHFNPDMFPMSSVFLTGTKTRSEMEREHPLELERIERSSEQSPEGNMNSMGEPDSPGSS